MTKSEAIAPSPPVSWIEVPPPALSGQGLGPYREGEISNLFDWAENPRGMSVHLMPHRSQFIVDIVQIEDNAVHQPSKPGDEIVVVLNGVLELTDDGDPKRQRFTAGDMVLIPSGWAGLYRVIADGAPFRELAIVPGDYFDQSSTRAPSGQSPRRIDPPLSPGKHLLHRARYEIEITNADAPDCAAYRAAGDEIVRVLAGTVTLSDGTRQATFGPGGVVVLPRGSAGTIQVAAGYRALVARWMT
jgi:uncharacterized cupin superfamily protein